MTLSLTPALKSAPVSNNSWSDPTAMDMAAASLQANSTDLVTFFEVLRSKLETTLGSALTVELQGGLFNKNKGRVKSLTVETGDMLLTAENVRGRIQCRKVHCVRGITLSSESMTVPAWIKALMTALQAEAQQSESARIALENLLT